MENNILHEAKNTSQEAGSTDNREREVEDLQEGGRIANRKFGIADIWSIRRGARVYKIHNRIPRL